jgi:hypothetical protein
MPSLLRNINRGYYAQDGIKRESKDLMAIIEQGMKKKEQEAVAQDKPTTSGGAVKRQLAKFDKIIKSKRDI